MFIANQPMELTGESAALTRTIISVIVPTLNEEGVIVQCLDSLVRQELPADQFEVIVVDNGSVDKTVERVRTFEGSLNLTLLQQANSHVSAVRNLGARFAKGQFLAFLDADCVAASDWLARALEALRSGDGGVIGAFYTIPKNSSWVARAWYRDMPRLRGPVSYVPAGTLFISHKVFSELGGFDPGIETSEDFEFCQRVAAAGYGVLAVPCLSTVHLGTPQTLSSFYRKQLWHGTGVRTVFLRNMRHAGFAKTVLLTVYTAFWMVAFVGTVAGAILTGKFAPLTLACAFLLVPPLALSLRTAAKRNRWASVAPLVLLNFLYCVARAISLLGATGHRAARPRASSPCATSADQGWAK